MTASPTSVFVALAFVLSIHQETTAAGSFVGGWVRDGSSGNTATTVASSGSFLSDQDQDEDGPAPSDSSSSSSQPQGSTNSEAPDPKLLRTADGGGVDAPSGAFKIRIMPSGSGGTPDGNDPRAEGARPPAEPEDPSFNDEAEDPPFLGEPIGGNVVFVLDYSCSMGQSDVGAGEDYDGNTVEGMSRIDCVRFEAVKMLLQLDSSDRLDFVLLAGMANGESGRTATGSPCTDAWMKELVEMTDGTRAEAIEFIKKKKVWFGTPTYQALYRATHDYGAEIDKLILLTDGAPYPREAGSWGSMNHKAAILTNFPKWFAPLAANGCKFVCMHIGQNPGCGTFLQDLAGQNGGSYIHK